MGRPEDEGLIPRICQELFRKMISYTSSGSSFRTEVSYLEIYNERVKDLLNSKPGAGCGLKVREHPKTGPYVQDLSRHLVSNYADVQELMARGNANRTTASTNMNDTSSRSHAIFTVIFSQAGFDSKCTPRETLSKLNLVDLAGSERANATGATGQRLLEGAHINKSLVTLGSVIKALAGNTENDQTVSGQRNKTSSFIPYRDSVLTWLLKDSLGGNSKTIMISTISLADVNYAETLSTLRYSNRAKDIINKPTINEDTNTKLIRDLRSEIERLKDLLGEHPNMIEKVHENEARVKLLTEEWTEKWKETHRILREHRTFGLRKSGIGVVLDSDRPHLIGIDDNVLSTGITLYHLKEGLTRLGSGLFKDISDVYAAKKKIKENEEEEFGLQANHTEDHSEQSDQKPDIVLNGPDVLSLHCVLELCEDGRVFLTPSDGACCYVNTVHVEQRIQLSQGCVLLLGHSNMFRFNDPQQALRLRKDSEHRNGKKFLCCSCGGWSGGSAPVDEKQNDQNKKTQSSDEDADDVLQFRCINCTMAQSHLLRVGSMSLSGLLSPGNMSRSAESIWSQLANNNIVDYSDLDLEEKRKEIEELEEEHRRAEERRREEATAADEVLQRKKLELSQLREESEELSALIAESTKRKEETEMELQLLNEQKERIRLINEQCVLINASNLSSIELNDHSMEPGLINR